MSRLDQAIAAAQSRAVSWDVARASRSLEAAQAKREHRARRDRTLRRGAVVVAGAGLLVLALFRSASGQPEDPRPSVVAQVAMNDAGYERD